MTTYTDSNGNSYDYDDTRKKVIITKGTGSGTIPGPLVLATLGGIPATYPLIINTSEIDTIGNYAFVYQSEYHKVRSATLNGAVLIGQGAFSNQTDLTYLSLSGTEVIGPNAFENTGIIEVTIPATIYEIVDGAFASCSNLTKITIESATPFTIGTGVFPSTAKIYVPDGTASAYKSAWPAYADQIVAPKKGSLLTKIATGIPFGL